MTCCFLHELEMLLEHNLIKGGDVNNAIVVVDKPIDQVELDHLKKVFKKDNIEIRTQYVEYNAFDTITEESAYWLGFISADGCLRGNTLSIGLQESDYNHLVKFKEFIKTENKIRLKKHFINNKIVLSYEISVSDKHLAETLNKLGINEFT